MKPTEQQDKASPALGVARVSLLWSPSAKANDQCRYNHSICETPFGRFLLTWKGWKTEPYDMGIGFDETPWGDAEYRGWTSVDEAQNWAAEEMSRRIALCLANT